MNPSPASVLQLAMDHEPTLGAGRLISIDGPAGSGKSTWAAAVAALMRDSRIIQMDDLFPGWAGLSRVDEQLHGLLLPLAEGRPGEYRRYDWVAGKFAETVTVAPIPLLLLEGVGSGASRFGDLQTLLVWVEAPRDERMRRGIERDGNAFAPHWEQWAADEAELFARERTKARADVVVDGTRPLG